MPESKSGALPLGYTPILEWWRKVDLNHRTRWELIYSQLRLATSLFLHKGQLVMVDVEGLEPPTPAV